MAKYLVTLTFYANVTMEVDAKDATAAIDKAEKTHERPSLCHQCRDVELGDQPVLFHAQNVEVDEDNLTVDVEL